MNRHQVLTGAANSGDRCFSVGSIHGIHFTAYAAGCKIVILSSDFQRVQVIPNVQHGVSVDQQVSCISCCSTFGKIAASYADKVCIFEPTLLPDRKSTHKLDYRWQHVNTIQVDCEVLALTWNLEGTRLLTAGEVVQLWQFPDAKDQPASKGVEFFFDDLDRTTPDPSMSRTDWTCIWNCKPASPVTLAKFSSDGLLFATVGKNDRLVKIWYENPKFQLTSALYRSSSVCNKLFDEVSYSFIYVAHPQAVTGFSWRHTSKYMNRGAVANMLVTSCKDNICRIWSETVQPEDGLVDVRQLDTSMSMDDQLMSRQNHKKRFIQRLQHIRHLLHMRKRPADSSNNASSSSATVNGGSVMSTSSIHESHKYGVHTNYIVPTLHFHLAASINANTDLPMLGPLNTAYGQGVNANFVVHWLNNKEFYYTLEAEKVAEDIAKQQQQQQQNNDSERASPDTVGGASSSGNGRNTPAAGEINGLSNVVSDPAIDPGVGKKKMRLTKSFMSVDGEKSSSGVTTDTTDTEQPAFSREISSKPSEAGADPVSGRIERLIQDWNQGTDMLFSVHPADGSFLVWMVDYLDEPGPGVFRQAQVSFSSLIPNAFPVCDAVTMEPHLWLYCDYGRLALPTLLESEDSGVSGTSVEPSTERKARLPAYTANAMGTNSSGRSDNMLTPNVLLLTKHTNGSLGLWQVTFADQSKFSTIVSIAHVSRASGHRFRTSSSACHPVLPLLLTSSHHNAPPSLNGSNHCTNAARPTAARTTETGSLMSPDSAVTEASPFCSELILWRVTAVGPLSKSGGLTELARINSPAASAFTSVAWLPSLLPTSSFGTLSNSPSALFVASDGSSLHIYQAVLDARSLLARSRKQPTQANNSQVAASLSTAVSFDSEHSVDIPSADVDGCFVPNIVSLQSTSRPGCIVELISISDATQDWRYIQLIHIFQERLVTGSKTTASEQHAGQNNVEAMVNLQNVSSFEETFYLVVVEKVPANRCGGFVDNSPDQPGQSVIHMWKIVIASRGAVSNKTPATADGDGSLNEADKSAKLLRKDATGFSSNLRISTSKVCTQTLVLPPGVYVNSVNVAAGHLSSASIYPACFAPYLLSTACSNGHVYFWRCDAHHHSNPFEAVTSPVTAGVMSPSVPMKYVWKEWEMMIRKKETSHIHVNGRALLAACAYSARVAVAYMSSVKRQSAEYHNKQLVNLRVAVYECESTGGSEWTLEDTIELNNVEIPTADSMNGIENGSIQISVPTFGDNASDCIESDAHADASTQSIAQLDWVSSEDGGHILTVGVGSQILLYASVAGDVALSLQPSDSRSSTKTAVATTRGVLQKSKSMAVPNSAEAAAARRRRWIQIRQIDLTTDDARPASSLNISWVRNGILVVGLDSEMHVYSQWHCPGLVDDEGDNNATGAEPPPSLTVGSMSLSTSFLHTPTSGLPKSMSSMKLDASIASLSILAEKDRSRRTDHRSSVSVTRGENTPELSTSMTKSQSVDSFRAAIRDCGLFEAARRASPVLPQYHPRQLIELLNFGKIRRVKAILSHLLRCIAGGSVEVVDPSLGQRSPIDSSGAGGSGVGGNGPEEMSTDYLEIMSIPPLPLYALLAADADTSFSTGLESVGPNSRNPAAAATGRGGSADYNTLFTVETTTDDVLEDPFDETEGGAGTNSQRNADVASCSGMTGSGMLNFTPAQAHLLARHLTHTQLPGMSSLDQMYLLAVAETVANTRVDFSEMSSASATGLKPGGSQAASGGPSEAPVTEAVDDCGLRFLLAARHHIYLLNTLPIRQRVQLQQRGLSPAYYIWAFHSESEEELLNSLPCMQKGTPTWAELRQFGAGWWLRNINTLQRCMEKLAKAAFQASKDPLDAALFYLAMKKKNLLWGLFRSVNDQKMATFFKNNFSEDRWRKAALKNAFSLLGMQKFQRAAAFFLLGGAVKDAIEVCLNKLDDFQLAMVLLRLYESDLEESMPSSFYQLLRVECLGFDSSMNFYDADRSSPDPFIRSMAFWIMKDYASSLATLLDAEQSASGPGSGDQDATGVDSYTSGPTSVFNFYNYLRTHPLIIRQNLALSAVAAETGQKVLLSGFSYGDSSKPLAAGDKNVTYVDRITPMERRLYFTTAHAHFIAGCPALALEVLIKLPKFVVDDEASRHSSLTPDKTIAITNVITSNALINTGTLSGTGANSVVNVDWSRPVTSGDSSSIDAFDWSQPSRRFEEDKLDLSFGTSESEDEDEGKLEAKTKSKVDEPETVESTDHHHHHHPVMGTSLKNDDEVHDDGVGDIMAHQLKFIACIKIMVDELSTLATGFEVDGGQLRYQLYVWLEKEVEVLKRLCNYGVESGADADVASLGPDAAVKQLASSSASTTPPLSAAENAAAGSASPMTMGEMVLAEHSEYENKLLRTERRRRWLEQNQPLLRTLLSFSVLHGSSGGGLISMRMELLLLLQEIQEQRGACSNPLMSPLPFPTTLPLLSAAAAGSKSVVADPLQHLQCMTRDLLHTVVEFNKPPDEKISRSKMVLMRNLSVSLSACMYQCLCDSDCFALAGTDVVAMTTNVGMEGFTSTSVVYKDSHLMAGPQQQQSRRRLSSTAGPEVPNSLPAKWPGVFTMTSVLPADSEVPKLNVLLCEALVAVYISLLSYSLALSDANVLYRLVGRPFHPSVWPLLFGGGLKKQITVTTAQTSQRGPPTTVDKARSRLHMRVLGPNAGVPWSKDNRAVVQEKFVPPRTSMVNYFMTKIPPSDHPGVDYDSADSISSQDEDDDFDEYGNAKVKNEVSANEHLDSNSYSWCLMRYAIVKYIRNSLVTFLPEVGIELSELAVNSPLVHAVHKVLEQWEIELRERLDKFDSAPPNYIPGVYTEPSAGGAVTIVKYHSIMDAANTPFTSTHFSALPAKRLWNYLVTRDYLHDVFIRYIFRKQRSLSEYDGVRGANDVSNVDPVKIIHKDQDALTCFCVNQIGNSFNKPSASNYLRSLNQNTIVVATAKEILELDISRILEPPAFLHDETEYDIEVIKNPMNGDDRPDDLVVSQTPYDSRVRGLTGTTSPPTSQSSSQTSSVMLKRPVSGVRRLASHPVLPYYLSGSQDGCVRLWEWGHADCISEPRKAGAFPKVTKVLFSAQGNKFGVSDAEGGVCLWQVGLGVGMSATNKPYLSFKCHSKVTSDFVFVGSSSLIATAGHSSDNRNVCLWDTLLPQRRALVQSFYCHPDGCPMVLYAPQHQVLISGGKKGEVCIFDVRQRQLQHTFQAHENNVAIKCLALDTGAGTEECFVTGGADGDIKVWSLAVHNLMYSFPGEHTKSSSSLFRAMGNGVMQLYLSTSGHMFSCGADGSLKVRMLPLYSRNQKYYNFR